MLMTNAITLIYRTLSLKFKGINANHINDYNEASNTYDDYYRRYLGQESLKFIENLPLKANSKVVDLACGTGFFSHYIALKIGEYGCVTAVDLSPGMLARNQHNAQVKRLNNIHFVESDAIRFLETLSNNSVDGVVCGWGICYMDHSKLRIEIERVIRPGGFVAIIENRACTLKAVSDLFRKILLRHPTAITKHVSINLPRDFHYLCKTFCKNSLKKISAWDGFVNVPCKNGSNIVEYMIKSGASAGFINAVDNGQIAEVLKEFTEMADRSFLEGKIVPVKHEYCALIAVKR